MLASVYGAWSYVYFLVFNVWKLDRVLMVIEWLDTMLSLWSYFLLLLSSINVRMSTSFLLQAGQASEPECLIPLTLAISNPEAIVVLAGDHKQLGAVVKSKIAESCGLSLSLLERVLQHPPYERHSLKFGDTCNYDPNLVSGDVLSCICWLLSRVLPWHDMMHSFTNHSSLWWYENCWIDIVTVNLY